MNQRNVDHEIWIIRNGEKNITKPLARVTTTEQITPEDESILEEISRGKELVIEVGSFTGCSSAAILRGGAKHLVCIDSFEGSKAEGTITNVSSPEMLVSILQKRLEPFIGRWSIIQGESLRTASMFQHGLADMIFIDAGHDFTSVVNDIMAWWPVIKDGGIMVGHDFDKVMPADMNEMVEHMHLDRWGCTHCGVILAVMSMFKTFRLATNDDSSLWYVNKDDSNAKWLTGKQGKASSNECD